MSSTNNPLHKTLKIDLGSHGEDRKVEHDSRVHPKVISLGLSRTGTTSLATALEILGFGPCHGGVDPMRDANRSRAFIDLQRELKNSPETSTSLSAAKAGVAQSTTARLKDLLAGYRSITDIPLNHLGPELYAAYPDAKYIVSLRPGGAKEWFRSFYSTVSLCYRRDWSRKRWAFLIWPVSWMTNMDHMVREAYHRMERDCGGVIDETCYDKHTEMVKKFIPEEQLLVFNLTDGWEPLCDFLDVPVPDQPFPKLNDAKQMQALFVGMQIYGAMVYTLFLGFFGVGVTAFFKPHLLPGMIRHRLPSFFSS